MSREDSCVGGAHLLPRQSLTVSRREMLRQARLGFGWLAFAGLSARSSQAVQGNSATHFTARAKRVIFLFMDGGVSHVDSFDPKPELSKRNGQPATWRPDPRSQAVSAGRKWLGSPWSFRLFCLLGLWVIQLFIYSDQFIDDLCVIRL